MAPVIKSLTDTREVEKPLQKRVLCRYTQYKKVRLSWQHKKISNLDKNA